MSMSLSELKALNEANANQEQNLEADYEAGSDNAKDLNQEQTHVEAEGQNENELNAEQESFLIDEDEENGGNDAKKFTDKDVAAAKHKLKAKLSKEQERVQELQREIEALKSNSSVVKPTGKAAGIPTLEQFDYDNEAFAQAMQEWVAQTVVNTTKAQQAKVLELEQQKALEESLSNHYERAAELVSKHNIDPELYRSAGLNLRKAVDQVIPGAGDVVTEKLLAVLGEGSEKVEYHLGRNAQKREALQAKLIEDPSGLKASVYLGKLLAELNEPARKTTKAPPPAARATGGEMFGSGSNVDYLKKYNAEKDPAKRFEIYRAAKKAGVKIE